MQLSVVLSLVFLLATTPSVSNAQEAGLSTAGNGGSPARKIECREFSMRSLHKLVDNGGEPLLTIEGTINSCFPVLEERRVVVKSMSGKTLRFSSRTEFEGRTRISSERSWFRLEFPDRSAVELKLGPEVLEHGAVPKLDYPGSVFSCGGRELSFSLEKPKKPVFLSNSTLSG